MRTVVVTGGMGSGKSAVCHLLQQRGIPVYNSDQRTKALYSEQPGLLEALEKALGMELRTPEGTLDRARLAARIFADDKARETLEGMVYPLVKQDFLRWREGFPKAPYVVLESAVILSKPVFDDLIDVVVLVQAPLQVRLRRIMARDHLSEEQIRSRLEAQPTPQRKPDLILCNDGSPRALSAKVSRVFLSKNAYICKLLKQI